MVRLHISTADGIPIYHQVIQQIKFLVASGQLAPGQELPSIRSLAEQLIVNPNTIARAYRELELAGVVEKRKTTGTYVTDQASPLLKREKIKILSERVDQLLTVAEQLDISVTELVALVESRHARFKRDPKLESER